MEKVYHKIETCGIRLNFVYSLIGYCTTVFLKKVTLYEKLLSLLYVKHGNIVELSLIAKKKNQYNRRPLDCCNWDSLDGFWSFVRNDELDNFVEYARNPSFDINIKTAFEKFNNALVLRHDDSIEPFPLVNYSAIYGSLKCFKFLIINDCDHTSKLDRCSIVGGNKEIVHIVEQQGYKFKKCLRPAVLSHRNELYEWIMDKYEPAPIDTESYVISYNEALLYYLIENGIPLHDASQPPSLCVYEAPLYYALEYMNIELADALIKHGENSTEPLILFSEFRNYCTMYTVSPLSSKYKTFPDSLYKVEFLTEDEVETIVKFLIINKADVNKRDEEGYSPLEKAVIFCRFGVVKLLVESGAVLYPDGKTRSLMIEASYRGDLDIVRYLYEHGGDVNEESYGRSPIITAITNDYSDIVQFLVEKGANVNSKSGSGYSPLYYSISQNNIHIVEFLLDHSANLDEINCKGETPLITALNKEYDDIAALLIKRGASIKALKKYNKRPLEFAISHHCEKSAELIRNLNHESSEEVNSQIHDIQVECQPETIDLNKSLDSINHDLS